MTERVLDRDERNAGLEQVHALVCRSVYARFLIGQALEHAGPGPWRPYVGCALTLECSVGEARELARAQGVRAWFHEGHDVYKAIPLDESPFSG